MGESQANVTGRTKSLVVYTSASSTKPSTLKKPAVKADKTATKWGSLDSHHYLPSKMQNHYQPKVSPNQPVKHNACLHKSPFPTYKHSNQLFNRVGLSSEGAEWWYIYQE